MTRAAALAAALGVEVGVAEVSEAQAREFMLGAGMSEEFADGALAGQAFVRAGGDEGVTGDLERALGRTPRSYADWVRDHAAAFTADPAETTDR
ncbi:hypothetical protein ACFOS0_01180 [Nocardia seriolae]|uniref:hypothetical protein n=1 Tax=Nocardia seriolae TaxID=37332 RepID=UPI00119769C6|nr:hypothetical protein [Nocardia seriolae]GEM28097.1 hypothetical protein NS2_63360 [Nocardia seriolae NBRC 15557]